LLKHAVPIPTLMVGVWTGLLDSLKPLSNNLFWEGQKLNGSEILLSYLAKIAP